MPDNIDNKQSNSATNSPYVAYVYARVSSQSQNQNGDIERQLAQLALLAPASKVHIEHFYADRAVSLFEGSRQREPGHQHALDRLRRDIERDTSDSKIIWVTDESRIARNRTKARDFFQWAIKHKIEVWAGEIVYSLNESGASSWFDAAVLAEERADQLSRQATAQHRVSRISGRKKWGFVNTRDGREMKPGAKQLVGEMFEMALAGAGLDELASKLGQSSAWGERNSSEARLRNKARQIIHDPAYAGFEAIQGDIYHRNTIRLERAAYEGAVSISDFLKVQMLLPKKVVRNSNEFYLAGRVNCGYCRKTLVAVRVDFRGATYNDYKLVKSAYACPNSGCRPSSLYPVETLHLDVKRLLQSWGRLINDQGFYERWEGSSRQEQMRIIKQTISKRRLLVATPKGLEDPIWLRNSR